MLLRLWLTLKLYHAELLALALGAVALWRNRPYDDLFVGGAVLALAACGLTCALAPNTVHSWFGRTDRFGEHFTLREKWFSRHEALIRWLGLAILGDLAFGGLVVRLLTGEVGAFFL